MTQSTLFDQDKAPERVFLLTNRYNLLEVLASRLIEPVEGFTKYYTDFLELCPGRLPLIGCPFPVDALSLVSAEDTTAFPVAIEIDRQVLGPDTPEIQLSGHADGVRVRAWAPAGAIPMTRAVAIHFRTAAELDEHRSRDYENVRQAEDRYRVSPELYEGSAASSSDLLEWLRSIERPPSRAAKGIDPDRLGGAITLMASVCPTEEAAIETLRRCLDGPRSRKGRRPHADWLVAALTASRMRKPSQDEILFRVSLEAFASADASQSWRGVEVLSAIWDAASPQLETADRDRLEAHFDRIRQILQSELPFERLRSHGPPSEKALLLALMRPDPDRLAAWSADETGADWSVMLASAALVGALRGRRRMSTNLRRVELDDLLAWREAAARNAAASATTSLDEVQPIRLDTAKTTTGRRLRLVAGTSVLGSWDVGRAAAGIDSALAPLARWEASRDPRTEATLIGLCDELGWDDCTMTVIDASAPLQEVEAGTTKYRVAGRVRIERMLNVDGLRTRLESAETAPEAKERALALLEAAPSQSGPDSHRYSN